MKDKFITLVQLIESEKLDEALENINVIIHLKSNDEFNKYFFKLLLYLSRTTVQILDKYDKHNRMTGVRIARLCELLCSLLPKVPDEKSFITSLYHIIRYLISFNLYEDAANICCYLQPGILYDPKNDTMELLVLIVSLWHIPINNIYSLKSSDSLSAESYKNLKNIIKYEIKMIQIAYFENYTKYLIAKISMHICKIATIDKERNIYFDDFYKHILEYLTEVRLCLDKDDKYVIYHYVLFIISCIVCKSISASCIKHAVITLNKLCSYFKYLLMQDEECHKCFQQFQNLCVILLTPVENFTNDTAKNIQDFIIHNKKMAQTYGFTKCLSENAINIGKIFTPLFVYYETYIKSDQNKFLDTNIMKETVNLVTHMSMFYMKDVSNKCKSCSDENCIVRKDIYNTVILRCKCINLITKFPVKILPERLCVLVRKVLEQSVALISEMKESKCKHWVQLWTTFGVLVYNIGITLEHVYKECAYVFSLLCTCIFRFQGVQPKDPNYLSFENPIFTALHRLCAVHYTNGAYREAMTASALNALLTYNTSFTKAFDMWVNIKKKCVSEKIAKVTILQCLREDKDKISKMGFTIDFSKYDLVQLCLYEAKCLLQEKISFADCVSAVLQELKELKPTNCEYAQAIQLLGHYLLGFEHNSLILEYHEQAISCLKGDKSNSVALLCLEVNLAYFTFVEELNTMNKQTFAEMENTKFAMYAPKLLEIRETKSPTVVPAYTMLNIKKDTSLMLSLQRCLDKWNQLIKDKMLKEIMNWEPNLILHMLITFAEYCRIYRHEKCEAEAWVLAYKLASEINDYCAIIYVTARSISLRQINYDWITTAKEYVAQNGNSKNETMINAIAIFWISLADFYFQCGKVDDAKKLLNNARSLPKCSFVANISTYLFSLDIIICNCNLYSNNIKREDYSSYIVESLYAMISLSHDLSIQKFKSQAEYLFAYDVLFTATVNLSMRMNHMLSFREISAHLVRRVKSAQSLGAVMRTAELLKSLCYIDLSRAKLEDCEVKLQGLEHMLDIETFQLSMNVKPSSEASSLNLAVSPVRIVDAVRDVPLRDTSPVLGKKIFDMPKFTLHKKRCDCYKCENMSYQYLVFATTYIRAQLYALQSDSTMAFDHFYGAFRMRQKLFEEKKTVLPGDGPWDESGVKQFSWQARSYITDYVQLLIDFSYFLEAKVPSRQQSASDVANLAIDICRKYKLEKHPVYISAEEITLNDAFQNMLKSPDCLDFMVPQAHNIDISKYMRATPSSSNVCVTPSVRNRYARKPASIRRKKIPVVFDLEKINMCLSDDEDGDM